MSIISNSSEHIFKLKHGFELTHSSILLLTNNLDLAAPPHGDRNRLDGVGVVAGLVGKVAVGNQHLGVDLLTAEAGAEGGSRPCMRRRGSRFIFFIILYAVSFF